MASGSTSESCVFKSGGVQVEGNGCKLQDCTVSLYNSKIEVEQNGAVKMVITMANIKNIQVHQPIFGANYISMEYLNHEGTSSSLQLTFSRGGATDFSRAFFRVAEGELVSTETASIPNPVPTALENKKNV